jgi:hypothetical protein
MLMLEVPVTPDAETARRWAEEELAKSAYHRGDSLFDRLGAWFAEQLGKLLDSTSGAGFAPVTYLIAALIIAAIILIATKVAVPAVRQRGRTASAMLLDDDTRTGSQIRAAAKSAAARGDHALAALEYFRAMVRSCEERVIIDERAGRTAREAARDIARALGAHQEDLRAGAAVFDELCYGHREGTSDDARRMASLDAELSHAKPLRMAMA